MGCCGLLWVAVGVAVGVGVAVAVGCCRLLWVAVGVGTVLPMLPDTSNESQNVLCFLVQHYPGLRQVSNMTHIKWSCICGRQCHDVALIPTSSASPSPLSACGPPACPSSCPPVLHCLSTGTKGHRKMNFARTGVPKMNFARGGVPQYFPPAVSWPPLATRQPSLCTGHRLP